ncbi:hypothetical protein AB5N19_07100 [Seiridium cardinale]
MCTGGKGNGRFVADYKKSTTEILREAISFMCFCEQDDVPASLCLPMKDFIHNIEILHVVLLRNLVASSQLGSLQRMISERSQYAIVIPEIAPVAIANKENNKEVLDILGEDFCEELCEKFTQRTYVTVPDYMVQRELLEDEIAHALVYINVDSQPGMSLARNRKMEGFSPLFSDRLLELGIDTELRDIDGLTPPIYAARDGRTDIVLKLLKEKAYIDAKDWNGATALSWAARRGHDNIFSFLVHSGAGIDIADRLEALRYRGPLPFGISQ